MEIKAEYLRQRYSTMETDELIELQRKGGLTEVAAGVLDEILKTRGVSDEIRSGLPKQIEETTVRSSEATLSQDVGGILKIKWLKIWIYFLTVNAFINIYNAFTTPDILFCFIAATFAIVQLSTAWGLHLRKLWAWRLNWVAILINYFVWIILPILFKLSYGYPEQFVSVDFKEVIVYRLTVLICNMPTMLAGAMIGGQPDAFGMLIGLRKEPGTELVLRIFFGALIWILPNIIYWEKRKNLFT